MSHRRSIRTQILIFTLFGEYIVPRGGSAWTSGLLRLLGILGVSERAARSTLSRMSRNGWLRSTRSGRHSRYEITSRGLRVVRAGETRIFEPRRGAWDGQWHLVVYSVPEGKRRLRARLRARLGWLGFGRLAPGTWVSPTDRREEVETDLDDLGARPYAVYFAGSRLPSIRNGEIVARCWDLKSLNREYAQFLKRYDPALAEARTAFHRGNGLSPAECFRRRFWLTLDYSQFPRRDPNLPSPLLPPDWMGTRAAQVFGEYHDLLRDASEGFVTSALRLDPADAVSSMAA
ncbi:MAG TPA: PaaX family transcriptional regulator C-terminal domain-containing protein [Anaerolineales bacterium]|nr:PaaX family transcriptional regulator C-terminal domain-containing protein [Anaerolineales bacterium]